MILAEKQTKHFRMKRCIFVGGCLVHMFIICFEKLVEPEVLLRLVQMQRGIMLENIGLASPYLTFLIIFSVLMIRIENTEIQQNSFPSLTSHLLK